HPHLIVIKCICHSLALCSSYACLQLPSAVETLARNIFNYISNSPKRSNLYKEIQKLLDIRPKKMLHPGQTRWLSLESVVVRILELYEPLKIYFSFAANVDKIDTANIIFENLNDTNEIYVSFLKYILAIINNINKMFQFFPIITKFVRKIMVLPHSSANVERVFSQVNLNKTKSRNSLNKDSMEVTQYNLKKFLKNRDTTNATTH
ncbi:uncharacterized protein LOC133324344, partial [Musca vetustissima]|uniref:uncharacterized protein LOC133324344 n=1 Tax=Musca vetustissima TaxID=27455 RepID=UPI002AB78A62